MNRLNRRRVTRRDRRKDKESKPVSKEKPVKLISRKGGIVYSGIMQAAFDKALENNTERE